MISFILLLPILVAILNLFLPKERDLYHKIALGLLGLNVVIMLALLIDNFIATPASITLFQNTDFSFRLTVTYDRFAQILLLYISILSFLIYQYAGRYLRSDNTRRRFLVQLPLAQFSVTLLAVSGNLLTAFISWQLIGLTIYLLLNHYHYDLQANRAAKKKFVINRLGDLCFLIAVVLVFDQLGSTQFHLLSHLSNGGLICGLIFVAVMTKSALFPFYIWLPDTMEAPTPVSAFMHAGVINAGGILLAKLAPLVHLHHVFMAIIVVFGCITAAYGSYLMRFQVDVKRKLAYSTMGQMGYMVVQCGVGAFSTAIFHLIAHGIYKATLFLGAGNTLQVKKEKALLPVKLEFVIAITAIIIAVGFVISFFVFHVVLPLLIWVFIAITIAQLVYGVKQKTTKWPEKIGLFCVFLILLLIYLWFVGRFSVWLKAYDFMLFASPVQWLVIAVIIVCLFARYTNFSANRWVLKFQHWLTYFTKAQNETFYREYLLRPIRFSGDVINSVLFYRRLYYVLAIIIAIGLFVLCLLRTVGPLNDFSQYKILMGIFIIAFIGSVITLNRCGTLLRIWFGLLFSQLCFVLVGLSQSSVFVQNVAGVYGLNMFCVLAMLGFLLLPRKDHMIVDKVLVRSNRLSPSILYLSIGLLLMIGIPGTPSFIAEISYLANMFHDSVLLTIGFACGMVLLTMAIMHALQSYVFDLKYTKGAHFQLSIKAHVFCIAVIVFNLLNGIFPGLLLSHVGGGV